MPTGGGTPEDFRKITGVGEKKLERYGVIFMGEIRRFCERQNPSRAGG
jgi:hypothetical protein